MIYNANTGLGYNAQSQSEYIYAEPIAAQEVYDCYLGSRLFARIVDTPAQHLAAAGFGLSLDGDANAEKISQSFDEYCKRIGTKGVMFQALASARLWGGAGVILWIDDGRPMDEPVDMGAIRSIQAVTFASRWELIPVEWGTSPLDERGKLNQPVMYRYTPRMRSAGRGLSLAGGEQAARAWHDYLSHGRKVHASRVLGFTGVKVPTAVYGIAGAYISDLILTSGWEGDTVYRALKRRIKDVSQTFEACAEFVRTVSSLVLQSPEVRDVIEAYGDDTSGSALKLKIDALRQRMGAFGMTALAPDENVIEVSRTAQGIQSLLDFVMVGLSADCHPPIPITFLFGLQPPGGLNGAGDADIQNYYRALDELRDQQYVGELRWLAKLILLAKDGPTRGVLPAVWDVQPGEFVSVSEAERIELELKRAQLLKEYVDLRAIAPEEIRADLKGQNNPLIQLSDEYDEILKSPSPGGEDTGAPPDMGGMATLQAHAENAQQPAQAAPEATQEPEAMPEQAPAPEAAPAGAEAQTRTDEDEMKPIEINGRLMVPVTDILAAGSRYAPLAVEALRQARLDAAETRFITMKHHLEGEAGHVIPIGVETKEGGGETWKMPSGKAIERTPEQAKASRSKAAAIARKIAKTSKHPAVIAEHEARAKALESADKPKAARKKFAHHPETVAIAGHVDPPSHPAVAPASKVTVSHGEAQAILDKHKLKQFMGHSVSASDIQHAMSNIQNSRVGKRIMAESFADAADAMKQYNNGDHRDYLKRYLESAGVNVNIPFNVHKPTSDDIKKASMYASGQMRGIYEFDNMYHGGKPLSKEEFTGRVLAASDNPNEFESNSKKLAYAISQHMKDFPLSEDSKNALMRHGLDPDAKHEAPKPTHPAFSDSGKTPRMSSSEAQSIIHAYRLSHLNGSAIKPVDIQHASETFDANRIPADNESGAISLGGAIASYAKGDRKPGAMAVLKRAGIDVSVPHVIPEASDELGEKVKEWILDDSEGDGMSAFEYKNLMIGDQRYTGKRIASHVLSAGIDPSSPKFKDSALELAADIQRHGRFGEKPSSTLLQFGVKPKEATAKPLPARETAPEAPPAIEANAPQHPAFKASSAVTVPEWKGRKLADTYALSHFRGHKLKPADMQHAMSNLAANAKPEDREGDYPDVGRALYEFNHGDRSPVLVDMLKRAGVDTDAKFHVPNKKNKLTQAVDTAGIMSAGGAGLFDEMRFNGKPIDTNEIANRIEAAHGEIRNKQAFDHAHELFSAMQAHNRGYASEAQKKVLRTYGLDPETLVKEPESKPAEPAEPADPASEPENVDPKHAAISQALSKHASGYRQPGAFKVNADVSPTVEHALKRVRHTISNNIVGLNGVYHDVDANRNHIAVTTDGNRLTMAPVSINAFAGVHGALYERDGKTLADADFPHYRPLVDSVVKGQHQPIDANTALNAASEMMQANKTIHGTKGITTAVLKNENGNLVMSYNVNGKRTSIPIGEHSKTLGNEQAFYNPMFIHEALSSAKKGSPAAMEFHGKMMAIHSGDGSIHVIAPVKEEQADYKPRNTAPAVKKAYQGVAKVPEGLQGAEAAEYQRVADTASLYDPARAKFESKPVESSSVEHALKRIKHTIAKDDSRYGLNYFQHHIDNNGNHVDVSTDGHRITIVPSSSAIEPGTYAMDGNRYGSGDEFPNYQQVFGKVKPTPNPAHAIDVNTLRSAAEAMTKAHDVFYKGTSRHKDRIMRLINVGDRLVARKDLLGHVIDVPVGHANPTIPKNGVSFNSKFIAEAMKVLGKNDATIQHTGDALSPVIIHGSDGSKHVIMPMRTE